jgi:transcriptional regulator with XRE-family HTH domain
MSPQKFRENASSVADDAVRRFWVNAGDQIRDARLRKRWSVADLASRAAMSKTVAYQVEAGQPSSIEAVVRMASALGLRLDAELIDPRKRDQLRHNLSADAVHSAMGEFEAGHFRALEFKVSLDEPYQHYQFAGRADVIAWDPDLRALLHIENRTRFPDFQEMAGAFNSKRAYLAAALADRVGVFGWRSETHVIAALWSSEVLHALRLRTNSFKALCPDPAETFSRWWSAQPPKVGAFSTLVVVDPRAVGRSRPWIGLDEALAARPRYRGYADAAATMSMAR